MAVLPQHTRNEVDGALFFSDFDSGNLMRVEKPASFEVTSQQYNLWVAPDAYERGFNAYRVWFNFGIQGLRKGSIIKFNIVNLGNMRHLYSNNYRPVHKVTPYAPIWSRLPSECVFVCTGPNLFSLSWYHEVLHHDSTIYFAFTFPYSYEESLATVLDWESSVDASTYFYRELLTYSLDHRRIDLLTITDRDNLTVDRELAIPGLFPLPDLRAAR